MAFPYKPAAHLLGSNGPIHAVAYSASPGTYILTGSADRSIRLYNPFPSSTHLDEPSPASRETARPAIPRGRLIQTYAAHGYEVLCVAVACDNETFVSGGGDRAVFLWDVSSATTLRRLGGSGPGGHVGRVNAVSFAGSGDSVIASGGFDTTVRLWDVRARSATRPVQVLSEARDAVTSVAVRGAEVVAGSVDGRVRWYDVRMGRCATDVMGASVTSVAVTRDGRGCLVGTLDGRVRLMDREGGGCLRGYEGLGERVNGELRVQAVMGGGERYVLAGDEAGFGGGGGGGGGRGGDVDGNGHDNGNGNGNGSADGDARLWAWDLLSGKVVGRLRVPWGPEGCDRKRMYAVGQDGTRRVRTNVMSCVAWKGDGWGDQFCVGGTSGVVTVFAAA